MSDLVQMGHLDRDQGQEPVDAGQVPVEGNDEAESQEVVGSETVSPETRTVAAPEAKATPGERFDAEYVKGLRSEAAGYRKRLRELEAQAKAAEEAKLSESERMRKRLEELESQAQSFAEEKLRYEVMLAAGRLGIVDPEAAFRLLDREELGEDGDIESVLREMLAKRPYLGGRPPSSPTNPAKGKTARLSREDVARMSAGEVNRRWDEVQAALAGD